MLSIASKNSSSLRLSPRVSTAIAICLMSCPVVSARCRSRVSIVVGRSRVMDMAVWVVMSQL